MNKFSRIFQNKNKNTTELKIGNKANNVSMKKTPQNLEKILLLKTNAERRQSVPLLWCEWFYKYNISDNLLYLHIKNFYTNIDLIESIKNNWLLFWCENSSGYLRNVFWC